VAKSGSPIFFTPAALDLAPRCRVVSARFTKGQGNVPDVRLVSISTDPHKDTPEVLQQYARRFAADEKWLFLTGSKAVIYELANKGFKLGVTDAGGTATEPITHSTKLVLVDRNGTVRGFYDGITSDEAKRLVAGYRASAERKSMTVQELPAVNASLNALSTCFHFDRSGLYQGRSENRRTSSR
jgi:hypothetical protein